MTFRVRCSAIRRLQGLEIAKHIRALRRISTPKSVLCHRPNCLGITMPRRILDTSVLIADWRKCLANARSPVNEAIAIAWGEELRDFYPPAFIVSPIVVEVLAGCAKRRGTSTLPSLFVAASMTRRWYRFRHRGLGESRSICRTDSERWQAPSTGGLYHSRDRSPPPLRSHHVRQRISSLA